MPRFDIGPAAEFESRDGGLGTGGLIRNGFVEKAPGGVWSWQRPGLAPGMAAPFSGTALGLLVLGTNLYGVINNGTANSYTITFGTVTSSVISAPGFSAFLGGTFYRLEMGFGSGGTEWTVTRQASLAVNPSFSGTTTSTGFYSEIARADVTQNDSYIVAGGGYTGVYYYKASQNGVTWEEVDSGYSSRPGNLVGFGTRVYRFSGVGGTGQDYGYTVLTKGTSTVAWNQATGTSQSAFGEFNMGTFALSTANGHIFAIGTATWTGGTSVLAVYGTNGGSGPFVWNLARELPSTSDYAINFQTRFGWNGTALRVAGTSGVIYNFALAGTAISTSTVSGFSAAIRGVAAASGTLNYAVNTSQLKRS